MTTWGRFGFRRGQQGFRKRAGDSGTSLTNWNLNIKANDNLALAA